jgi:predicted  nucleic acid-binding Zn-ribbon protein
MVDYIDKLKMKNIQFHECYRYGHIFQSVGDYLVCIICGFNKLKCDKVFAKSKTQGATPSFNKDYQEISDEVSQIPNGTSDNSDIKVERKKKNE